MKIAVASEEFQNTFGYERAFAGLREIGYEGVDFCMFGDYRVPLPVFGEPRAVWTEHYRQAAAALKNAGIAACQCHGTYPTDFTGERRLTQTCLDYFKRQIEAAAILACPYIVIHPINIARYAEKKEEDFAANLDAFGKLDPILKEFGVKLGVENMFGWDGMRRRDCPTGVSTPEDMLALVEALDSDRFVCCLDTGHMQLNCVRPGDAARKLGKTLKLLHVHDNDAVSDQHLAPPNGTTDWKDFAAALKEIGYDGFFSMETIFFRAKALSDDFMWDYARCAYLAAKTITAGL